MYFIYRIPPDLHATCGIKLNDGVFVLAQMVSSGKLNLDVNVTNCR